MAKQATKKNNKKPLENDIKVIEEKAEVIDSNVEIIGNVSEEVSDIIIEEPITIIDEIVEDTIIENETIEPVIEIVNEIPNNKTLNEPIVEDNKVSKTVITKANESQDTKKREKTTWPFITWLRNHKLVYFLVKLVLCVCLLICANIATMALTYFGYIQYKTYRISDGEELDVLGNRIGYVTTDKQYTAITMNIGSGIHVPEYSSVHESGAMTNGSKTKGEYNYGISEEGVVENMHAIQNYVRQLNADFYSFQEVDVASTRSHMINEYELLNTALASYSKVASRFHHTQYLLYPFKNPIGLINSDTIIYSRYKTTYGLRKQLPIKSNIFSRLAAMDNSFSLSLHPVYGTDNKFLLILNVNLDSDPDVRKKQIDVLNDFILEEYEYGSYVIVAGNFNSDTAITDGNFANDQKTPSWLSDFDESQLYDEFTFVHPTNETEIANFHPLDRPYEKGVSYEAHTNGFIITNNITAEAVILDTEYMYSNHNPVKLTFSLNKPE